jgi:S1-C subfamily serine protease
MPFVLNAVAGWHDPRVADEHIQRAREVIDAARDASTGRELPGSRRLTHPLRNAQPPLRAVWCACRAVTGKSLKLSLLGAAGAAVMVMGSALVLGRAGGAAAVTAATPQTGVVVINTNLALEGGAAAGTGIVLSSSGVVLTNNHVIRGATTIHVTDPSDRRTFAASVVGYSVSKDIAVLKLKNPSSLHAASMGNSSNARVGQAVTAVGNAGGTGSLTTVTGRVTGLGQAITVSDDNGGSNRLTGLIETSAPLQPGDSGGPLLAGGRVIGVDAAADSNGTDGFAIPINTAISLARQIQGGHRSASVHVGPTAFLGVLIAPSDGFGQDVTGAVVQRIVPGTAADRAGLGEGDVITSLGGRTVTSAAGLQRAVLQTSPGKPTVLRWSDAYGYANSATVRLAAGPPQ